MLAKRASTSSVAADPFSTPARRRRIIAEVARFLLKSYCVKAVNNVIWLRKRQAAALVLQCAVRCWLARTRRRTVFLRRRNAAAVCIQMLVRSRAARRELLVRKLEQRRLRGLKLARLLQKAWREKQRRKRAGKQREAHMARLLRRKNEAARKLQYYFRMLRRRKKSRMRVLKMQLLVLLRVRAAVLIEAAVRVFLAKRYVARLKRRLWAIDIIAKRVLPWWKSLRARKHSALGACVTALVSWVRYKRMRNRFAKALRKERRATQDRLRNESTRTPTRKIEMRVAIGRRKLYRLMGLDDSGAGEGGEVGGREAGGGVGGGPAEVVRWCLEQSLLSFSLEEGYSFGKILWQVFGSVDAAFPGLLSKSRWKNEDDNEGERVEKEEGEEEEQKIIKVEKWDNNNNEPSSNSMLFGSSNLSNPDYFPRTWGKLYKGRGGKGRSSSGEDGGGGTAGTGFSLELLCSEKEQCITLLLTKPPTQTPTNEFARFSSLSMANDTDAAASSNIVFSVVLEASVKKGSQGQAAGGEDKEEKDKDIDLKFRLENVLVVVEPCTSTVETALEEPSLHTDSKNTGTKSPRVQDQAIEEQPVAAERIPLLPSRPATARKILVSLDPRLEEKAKRIQASVRGYLLKRRRAARRIKRCYFRFKHLGRFQQAVLCMLQLAHQQATVIQTRIRASLCRRKTHATRAKVCAGLMYACENIVRHRLEELTQFQVFLKNDAVNYSAFGVEGGDISWAALLGEEGQAEKQEVEGGEVMEDEEEEEGEEEGEEEEGHVRFPRVPALYRKIAALGSHFN